MFSSIFIYFSIFVITSLLIELSTKLKDHSTLEKIGKSIFLFFTLSIPAFFAAIRYGIGTDFFNYVNLFRDINSGIVPRTEFGFNILNLLVGQLGGNIHHLFFIMSFLTILLVYFYLNRYKSQINVGLGMFIFLLMFYNMSFNVVRQVLAMTISLMSFVYIEKKQPWKFTLITLLGASIHSATIIVFPFYILYNKLASKGLVVRIFIYLIVVFAIFNYDLIIEFISIHILEDSYYLNYAQTSEVDAGIGLLVSYLPFIVIGSVFYKNLTKYNSSHNLYFFLLIIGFLLKLIAYLGVLHLNRIGDYFTIVLIWIIPYYYEYFITKRIYFWIGPLMIMLMILMWFYTYIISGSSETIPYTTIFY